MSSNGYKNLDKKAAVDSKEAKGKIAVALAFLAAAPFVFITQVWVLMLAFGGLHSIFEKVPAFGFWGSALILLVTSILFKNSGSTTASGTTAATTSKKSSDGS